MRHDTKAVEGMRSGVVSCCFCGENTTSGIHVRHNPSDLGCKHRTTKHVGIEYEDIRPKR